MSTLTSTRSNVPSPWFRSHTRLVGPGMRVLDLAGGAGRHAIAAAAMGAEAVVMDLDEVRMEYGREVAEQMGVEVEWCRVDLRHEPLQPETFDLVMGFNYLDRSRMPDFVAAVRPGGFFMYETFLNGQIEYEWGPTSPDHLLRPGELLTLVTPLVVEFAREVVESRGERLAAVASVLARRPGQ